MIFWAIQICATATAIGVMVRLLDSWGGLPLDWWQWAVTAGVYGALSNWAQAVTIAGKNVAIIQNIAHSPMQMAWRFVCMSAFCVVTGGFVVGLVVGTILWVLF